MTPELKEAVMIARGKEARLALIHMQVDLIDGPHTVQELKKAGRIARLVTELTDIIGDHCRPSDAIKEAIDHG